MTDVSLEERKQLHIALLHEDALAVYEWLGSRGWCEIIGTQDVPTSELKWNCRFRAPNETVIATDEARWTSPFHQVILVGWKVLDYTNIPAELP